MAECENCSGLGKFDCEECEDDGACEFCDGHGTIDCDECGGSGEVDEDKDEDDSDE